MARFSWQRVALIAAASTLGVAMAGTTANAALDMVDGARSVVQHKPISDCSAKAKSALNSVLQGAFEAGAGTGQWMAFGTPDSAGNSAASAAIHCYPINDGYVVTLTCAVDTPPYPDSANVLCTKLATAFGIQSAAITTTGRGR
jgi:hypothetical protein